MIVPGLCLRRAMKGLWGISAMEHTYIGTYIITDSSQRHGTDLKIT